MQKQPCDLILFALFITSLVSLANCQYCWIANVSVSGVPQPNATCRAYCYCLGTACDSFTGNCGLGCQADYYDSACNKRKGEFKNAPTVVSTCAGVTISWNPLNVSGIDMGEPPSNAYTNYKVFFRNGTLNSYPNLLSSSGPLSLTLQQSYFNKMSSYEFSVAPLYDTSVRYPEEGVTRNFSTPIYPFCLDLPSNINYFLVNDNFTITWNILSTIDAVKTVITYQALSVGDCLTLTNSSVSIVEIPYLQSTVSLNLSSLWTVYRITLQLKDIWNQTGPIYTFPSITTREAIPIGTPQNLTVTSISNISIVFTWSDPDCSGRRGNLLIYSISVTGTLSSGASSIGVLDNQTPFKGPVVASSLQPGVLYSISVAYLNSKGIGPAAVLQVTTLYAAEGTPRNLAAVESTISSIVVSWQPPFERSTFVVSYLLKYWSITPSTAVTNVSTNLLSWNVTMLYSAVTYTFQVAAIYNDSGLGPFTLPMSATTKVIAQAPQNIRLVNSNLPRLSTGVAVAWNVPPDITGLTGFIIYANGMASPNVSASVTSYNFTGLRPATFYQVTVAALYSDGKIWTSNQTLSFWTASSPFTEGTIPVPSIVTAGDTYIDVRISPITAYDSPVSQYGLIYYSTSAQIRRRRTAPEADLATALGVPNSAVLVYRIQGNPSSASVLRLGSNTSLSGDLSNPSLQPATSYKMVAFAVSTAGGYSVNGSSMTVPFTTNPPTSINGGIIAAIIIFILLVLILIALLIWLFWRRSNKDTVLVYRNKEKVVTKPSYVAPKCEPRFYPTWSVVHELHEPRRLILDVSYGPSDSRLNEILHRQILSGISFEEEYKSLPEAPVLPIEVGLKRTNHHKNVSPNEPSLLPYDKTRVTLQRSSSSSGTDYINASFINGYLKRRTYIVAQSPFNEDTGADFWLMIYQQNVSQIVMLCECEEDNRITSSIYWPDIHEHVSNEDTMSLVTWYGQVGVILQDVRRYTHYTIRQLKITFEGSYNKNASRKSMNSSNFQTVFHYQFHSWPMDSRGELVPDSTLPLLEFHTHVRVDSKQEDGPLVVHCNTGITRSGVFIAFDILLQQAVRENQVNVYTVCRELRKQRHLMVAAAELYMFIYDMLGEAMLATHFLVDLDVAHVYKMITTPNPKTKRTFLDEQHCLLERYTPSHAVEMSHKWTEQFHTRCPSIVPNEKCRVRLSSNRLMNALWVDGINQANQYIITETPSNESVDDFWSIIQDYEVCCVVDMEPACYGEDGAVPYSPDNIGERHVYGTSAVTLKHIEEFDKGTIQVKQLNVRSLATGIERFVYQYQFLDNWEQYERVPPSCHALVSLVNHVQTVHQNGLILVHCLNGASRSGLFIITHLCISKLNMDHYADVFHIIKSVKMRRSHVLAHLEQHRLLYKTLWRWVNLYKERELQTEIQEGTLIGHISRDILESSHTYLKAAYAHQHDPEDLHYTISSDFSATMREHNGGMRSKRLESVHYSYAEAELKVV